MKTNWGCGDFGSHINTYIMRTKIQKNLVSFPTIRRGNWQLKASLYKDSQFLVVANNMVTDAFVIRTFDNDDEASKFINFLVDKDDV